MRELPNKTQQWISSGMWQGKLRRQSDYILIKRCISVFTLYRQDVQMISNWEKSISRRVIDVKLKGLKMSDSDEILFDDIYELHEVIGEFVVSLIIY